MEGETEVSDLSLFLHLQKVRDDMILFTFIDLHRPLGNVVQEIEIKIIGLTALQRDIE